MSSILFKLTTTAAAVMSMAVAPVAADHPWPRIPGTMRETPYLPESPGSLKPMPDEQRSGAVVFTRHLTEPVWPQSRPESHERAGVLRGFAARGQKLTFNFAILPLAELRDIRVSVSPARGPEGAVIAPDRFDARLVAYWPVKYPLYLSRTNYRVMPEYLDGFKSFGTRIGMPRRIFLTLDTPEDAVSGIYRAVITVAHRSGRHEIPLEFRIYGFRLESDPDLRYSVYQPWYRENSREPQFPGRSTEWYDQAAASDFAAMRSCGINNFPAFFMKCVKGADDRLELVVPNLEENLPLMREAGFDGVLPVIDCGFGDLYREFTGKFAAKHIVLPEPPPEAMYEELDRLLREFRRRMTERGYPEMIFCPLDEIAPQSSEVGRRIYEIFRRNGLRTFATKDPLVDPAAAVLSPWVNAWASQGFVPAGERRPGVEYWSYPNHNSYEIKDPLVMCRGGRMTFGFGFWRSGCRMLIPWVWRSANRNHLDARRDAGGNRLEEDGSVTLTPYWINFREGVIDAQYIYTLRCALHRRRNAADPELKRELARDWALLESLWQRIPVERQYQADNSPTGTELDAWRQELAEAIARLQKFPENAAGQPGPAAYPAADHQPQAASIPDAALEILDLLDGNHWQSITRELTLTPVAGGLDVVIDVDYHLDGENSQGKYLIGWPRMRRIFNDPVLDLGKYDFLRLKYTLNSNRDDEARHRTPAYIQLAGGNGFRRDFYILDTTREGEAVTLLYPLRKIFDTTPAEAVKTVNELQFGIKEREFRDGDRLQFHFHHFDLIRFVMPVLERIELPGMVSRDAGFLAFKARVAATDKGDAELRCELRCAGRIVQEVRFAPVRPLNVGGFDLSRLKPGEYTVVFRLLPETLPPVACPVKLLPGVTTVE